MKLYHGTSRKRRAAIKKRGLRRWSYFTTRKSEAVRYARSGYRDGTYNESDTKGDVWSISIKRKDLSKKAWRLGRGGGAYGSHYKFYKKPPRPKRIWP